MPESKRIGGSFRDPSGFAFVADGIVYRQVNESYRANFDQLMDSGLYDNLVDRELLIPHSEACLLSQEDAHKYKILKPEQIPFISYPYEWSFSQLKDAALATLDIQSLIAVSIFCDPGVAQTRYLKTRLQNEESLHLIRTATCFASLTEWLTL